MATHGESVEIVFGAQIAGLTAGVNHVKEEIEALRAPIEGFVSSLGGVAEVIGAAFAVEKIIDWTKEAAEAAEKTDILAGALGIATTRLSEFQNMVKLAGGEGVNFVRVSQMIGRQLEVGITDPFSKQRAAMDAARIGLAELSQALRDPIATLDLLRQKWQELAGEPNRLNIFRDLGLGPRIIEQLLPWLEATDEKVKELKRDAEESGANLSDHDVNVLRAMQEEINKIDRAWEGLKKTILVELKEPILECLEALQQFVKFLKDNVPAVEGWFKQIGKYFGEEIQADIDLINSLKAAWRDFEQWWDDLQERLGHGRPSGTTRIEASAELPPKSSPEAYGPPAPPADTKHPETSSEGGAGAELKGIVGNAKIVADALEKLGLTTNQIAGVLANFQRESHFDPSKVGSSGDTGLAQWTAARLEALKAQMGPEWNTIEGQTKFFLSELQSKFAGVLARLREAKSPEEAARIFGAGYEIHHGGKGPAFDKEQDERAALAGDIAGGSGVRSATGTGGPATPLPNYKQDYADFTENEKRKLAAAKDDYAAQLQIVAEWQAHVLEIYAKDGVEAAKASKEYQQTEMLRTEILRKQAADRFKIADEEARHRHELDTADLTTFKAQLEAKVTAGTLSESAVTATIMAETQRRYELELQYFKAVQALADKTPEETRKVNAQIETLEAQHNAKMAELAKQLAAQEKKEIDTWLGPLRSGIEQAAKGLISGRQTPQQAAGQAAESAITGILDKVMGKLFDKLETALISTLPDALKSALGIGTEAAGTAALTGAATALTTSSGALDTSATGLGAAGTGLTGAAAALSGAAAALSSAAAFKAAVPFAARGWQVPSFDSGGILGMLHPNEMVLPADISLGLQGAIRGGGLGGGASASPTVVHIHANDAQSVAKWAKANGAALLAGVNGAMRNGSTLRSQQ